MRGGNILINQNLWKIGDLKEVCSNLDFFSQLSKMGTSFKSIDLQGSELVGNMRRHYSDSKCNK